ncbi:MAG: 50S ribosomal protein L24 [Chloroflexi bacterium]|nr:50S ribosomal protein L24 [Chloroflexota bacterium]
MKIKKDDEVLVISGKDRGKKGKVHRVMPDKGKVIVAGVNVTKRHMKPRGTARQAGIVEREGPLDISNVALLCDKCGKPTRVGYVLLTDGTKARTCRRCGEVISE